MTEHTQSPAKKTLTVEAEGWKSIRVSTQFDLEPVYDDDGSIDEEATLSEIANIRLKEEVAEQMNQLDDEELVNKMGHDLSVFEPEIVSRPDQDDN